MEEAIKPEKRPLNRRILLAAGLPTWVLASFIISALIIGLLAGAISETHIFGSITINQSLQGTIVAALVYILTLVIVIGVPLKLWGVKTTREELGLTKWPTWWDMLLAPAGFILYAFLAAALIALVSKFFPQFNAEEAQDVGFDAISQNYEYVLAFITLVVIAPISEEILIRGYLYGKLRKVVSVLAALLISALLFSLMHFQWNVAINVFPLAVIMVVLREMTGSIWAGIMLHMIKNGLAFYLLFINPSFLHTMGG